VQTYPRLCSPFSIVTRWLFGTKAIEDISSSTHFVPNIFHRLTACTKAGSLNTWTQKTPAIWLNLDHIWLLFGTVLTLFVVFSCLFSYASVPYLQKDLYHFQSHPFEFIIHFYQWIILSFRRVYKATVSFVMSVCLSVRMEQLCSNWTDFYEIWCLKIFSKICLEKSSFIKTWQE